MLTVLTTTNCRPLCFGLLERWMMNQHVKPQQWIVIVDGCYDEYTFTMGQEVVHRQEEVKPNLSDGWWYSGARPTGMEAPWGMPPGWSLCQNWKAAIPLIKGDKVIVWDDDDYYHPTQIAVLSALLEQADLVGIANDFYYNLPNQTWTWLHNYEFCCLGASGFKASLLPLMEELTNRNVVSIDTMLWREARCTRKTVPNRRASNNQCLHVGMKGMPGAAGLGIGHGGQGTTDRNFNMLRQVIGVDTNVYAQIYREVFH